MIHSNRNADRPDSLDATWVQTRLPATPRACAPGAAFPSPDALQTHGPEAPFPCRVARCRRVRMADRLLGHRDLRGRTHRSPPPPEHVDARGSGAGRHCRVGRRTPRGRLERSDPAGPTTGAIARRAGLGAAVGLVAAAVVVGFLATTRAVILERSAPAASMLVVGLVTAGLYAMRDELLLHGLVMRVARQRRGASPQGARLRAHVGRRRVRRGRRRRLRMAIAAQGLLGIVFGSLWVRDRGAWPAWGAHTAWLFGTGLLMQGGLFEARVASTPWGGADAGPLGGMAAVDRPAAARRRRARRQRAVAAPGLSRGGLGDGLYLVRLARSSPVDRSRLRLELARVWPRRVRSSFDAWRAEGPVRFPAALGRRRCPGAVTPSDALDSASLPRATRRTRPPTRTSSSTSIAAASSSRTTAPTRRRRSSSARSTSSRTTRRARISSRSSTSGSASTRARSRSTSSCGARARATPRCS